MIKKSDSEPGRSARFWCVAFAALVLAGLVTGTSYAAQPANQSNCDCYYARDCADKDKMSCNRQSACKRNCVHEDDLSAPKVTVTAQCDDDPDLNGPGACWDDEPTPAVGTDGDGKQCDPPKNTKTGRAHKIMDGNCTWDETEDGCASNPSETVAEYVEAWTGAVLATIEAGGGPVPEDGLLGIAEQLTAACALGVTEAAFNLAYMNLGDFYVWPADDTSLGAVAEIPPGELHLAVEVVTQSGSGLAQQIRERGGNAIEVALDALSADAGTWVQSQETHCEYPHPEEHGHQFFWIDGVDCLVEELTSIAGSMTVLPEVNETRPRQTP